MLTPEQLAEIEARDRARTPGVWACRHPLRRYSGATNEIYTPNPSLIETSIHAVAHCYGENFADGDFIAACSTAVPDLCTALRDAWMEIQQLKAKLKLLEPADY